MLVFGERGASLSGDFASYETNLRAAAWGFNAKISNRYVDNCGILRSWYMHNCSECSVFSLSVDEGSGDNGKYPKPRGEGLCQNYLKTTTLSVLQLLTDHCFFGKHRP